MPQEIASSHRELLCDCLLAPLHAKVPEKDSGVVGRRDEERRAPSHVAYTAPGRDGCGTHGLRNSAAGCALHMKSARGGTRAACVPVHDRLMPLHLLHLQPRLCVPTPHRLVHRAGQYLAAVVCPAEVLRARYGSSMIKLTALRPGCVSKTLGFPLPSFLGVCQMLEIFTHRDRARVPLNRQRVLQGDECTWQLIDLTQSQALCTK